MVLHYFASVKQTILHLIRAEYQQICFNSIRKNKKKSLQKEQRINSQTDITQLVICLLFEQNKRSYALNKLKAHPVTVQEQEAQKIEIQLTNKDLKPKQINDYLPLSHLLLPSKNCDNSDAVSSIQDTFKLNFLLPLQGFK